MKKCRFCAKDIQDAAILCRFCGRDVVPAPAPADSAKFKVCASCGQQVRLVDPQCWNCRSERFQADLVAGTPATVLEMNRHEPDGFEDICELARQGNTRLAGKLFRERTGWGLVRSAYWVAKAAKGKPAPAPAINPPAQPGDTSKPAELMPLRRLRFVGWAFGIVGVVVLILISGVLSRPPTGYIAKQPPALAESPVKPPSASATPDAAGDARVAPPAQTARTPVTPSHSAAAESAREVINKFVNLGFIKRMDVNTGKFYVDGELWVGFEFDQKEQIVKAISAYREAEHGLPQVTLQESRSGKELASYGALSGVTIR